MQKTNYNLKALTSDNYIGIEFDFIEVIAQYFISDTDFVSHEYNGRFMYLEYMHAFSETCMTSYWDIRY